MAAARTIVLNIIGNSTSAKRAIDEVQAKSAELGKKFGDVGKFGAAGLAGFAADAVRVAANFQEATTQLVTGAGESQAAIGKVSQGLLDMSTQVGVSATDLAKGMFLVESAGFHGAQGLSVMKAAAEGARVGAADMSTVSDGLTTVLNAYNLSGDKATSVTNQLVTTMQSGKMHMQDLAASLGRVVPIAAAVGINFSEVGGAMATMTNQGVNSEVAAQHLGATIKSLANPTSTAVKEMTNLGLNSVDVSGKLGSRGLAGTLQVLVDALEKKTGPAGLVAFQALAGLTVGSKKYQETLTKLPPEQQTFVAGLAKMVGGNRNLDAALQLTGAHFQTFVANSKAVGDAATHTSGDVTGWAETTKDFSFKVAQLKAAFDVILITVGNKLIPVIEALAGFFSRHITLTTALVALIGVGLFTAMSVWLGQMLLANTRLVILGAQILLTNVRVGASVLAYYASAAATTAWSAAQTALNVVLSMNPIALVVIAIAALVAGLILAYKNVGWFRDMVNTAFTFVKNIVTSTISFISGNWKLILAILTGPIGLAVFAIAKYWDNIKSGATGLIKGVGDAFKAITSLVADPFRLAFDAIKAAWNSTVGGFGVHIPGFLGFGGVDLTIPQMAQGGIVTSPTLALIGERGPEAVVPLGNNSLGTSRVTIQIDSRVMADVTFPHTRNKLLQLGRNMPNLGLS